MSTTIDACVAHHIGDRKEQQDRVAVIPHPKRRGMLIAALADGMGGHTGGGIAAEQVIHKARHSFEAFAPKEETARELLATIIDEAHVVIKLTRFTSEQDPHSTAAVLMLQPDRVDWVHCGDSRIYHFHGGKLVKKSEDHSLVMELVRMGAITEHQALTHPQRNILLACLGAEREPQKDFGSASPLACEDAFLLCSDGLWSHFTDAELGAILAAHPPRAAAEILIKRARERAKGYGDNISLAIIKLSQSESKKPGLAKATA
jgi:serine/threonine protein phosphatase PrpC